MKLSKRIRDLVRSGLTSPQRFSGLRGKASSHKRMEAQLEQIRKSLTRAAVREKRLQDDLAVAEEQGLERDAIRLRRELADLNRSKDELRASLDLIEARIEMELERKGKAGIPPSVGDPLVTEEVDSPQTSVADSEEGADLAARKSRLATPETRRGPEAKKPD